MYTSAVTIHVFYISVAHIETITEHVCYKWASVCPPDRYTGDITGGSQLSEELIVSSRSQAIKVYSKHEIIAQQIVACKLVCFLKTKNFVIIMYYSVILD